jgi:hypothetical protein
MSAHKLNIRCIVGHCLVVDVMFGVSVKNSFKLYDRVEDKWYLLACRTSSDKSRWLRALESERQRVSEDRVNGFTIESLRRPAGYFNKSSKRASDVESRAKGFIICNHTLKKLSSFIRSCIGDVIYDRYEKAKVK